MAGACRHLEGRKSSRCNEMYETLLSTETSQPRGDVFFLQRSSPLPQGMIRFARRGQPGRAASYMALTLALDVKHMESLLPQYHGEDAYEIPGARALLKEIGDHHVPWAVVTSGTVPLVTGWLRVLGLPNPEHLVTAESVQNG